MEYGPLGRSGLSISRISFGTATFGGTTEFEGKIGNTDVAGARRIIGICRDAGINYFNSSDVYSLGAAEAVLGEALGADRKQVLIGTKATCRVGDGVNDVGSTRHHLLEACEASLRRLRTDYIDIFILHYPDSRTPLDETLRTLDDLVRSGKVRYIGCSNFSAWQVMQGLGVSERQNLERFVVQEVSYSLVDRSVENEFVPMGLAEGLGLIAWGPLAAGFLSGKFERGKPLPAGSRLQALPQYPAVPDWDKGFDILDVVREVAGERGVTAGQVALNWLLRKPWVTSVLTGARTEAQLQDNLKTVEWVLTEEEVARLDLVSARPPSYPYAIQEAFNPGRNPSPRSYRA
jgi:aryl-alcohol dehydrogenase-like predicted oxidoreductase